MQLTTLPFILDLDTVGLNGSTLTVTRISSLFDAQGVYITLGLHLLRACHQRDTNLWRSPRLAKQLTFSPASHIELVDQEGGTIPLQRLL